MITPEELMAAAKAAAANAYIPYSGFRVGAAVLDADGSVTVGCNVENAGYGSTICAERTALVSAVAQGRKQPTALAVYTEPGVSPCGSCRQVMVELGPRCRCTWAMRRADWSRHRSRSFCPMPLPNSIRNRPRRGTAQRGKR